MSVLSLISVGHAHMPGEWLFEDLSFDLALGEHVAIQPKSGSYPVVGKPDVGFGGPMMGAMRSLM
jgi:hypothetical protein